MKRKALNIPTIVSGILMYFIDKNLEQPVIIKPFPGRINKRKKTVLRKRIMIEKITAAVQVIP
jgi:hypothetical protein